MSDTPPRWGEIERSGRPEYFVGYLDKVTAQSEIQRYKRRTYQLLEVGPGARVLDVGCGTGDDAIALAGLVDPGGAVVGIDNSASIIEEARRRVVARALPVELRTGDAHCLDIPDDSFDACRADRVLMHLRDQEAALAEMVRVTRPGGRVVVREPDWDTLVIDGPDRALTRALLHGHFDRVIRNGGSGRQLYRLLRRAGLIEVEVADTSTLVLTDYATANQLYGLEAAASALAELEPSSRERAADWLRQLQEADRQGQFFSAVTGFTVIGRKPVRA